MKVPSSAAPTRAAATFVQARPRGVLSNQRVAQMSSLTPHSCDHGAAGGVGRRTRDTMRIRDYGLVVDRVHLRRLHHEREVGVSVLAHRRGASSRPKRANSPTEPAYLWRSKHLKKKKKKKKKKMSGSKASRYRSGIDQLRCLQASKQNTRRDDSYVSVRVAMRVELGLSNEDKSVLICTGGFAHSK